VLQVERSSDDTVKLKILQTALMLLQNPSNADDQVSVLRLDAVQRLSAAGNLCCRCSCTMFGIIIAPWKAAAAVLADFIRRSRYQLPTC
jgi:hypothetical protein